MANLTGAQRKALEKWLRRPVVPGSGMTNKQLKNASKGAATVRYGGAERQARENVATAGQMQRDTGDFYQQYLDQLQKHQENVAAYQKGANDAFQKLQGALGGLQSPVELGGGGTVAAEQAAGVRGALTGSFGSMLASQGAANNTYADTLAHVVGPGQKLQAQTEAQGRTRQARSKLGDLLKEKGAFRQTYEADTRSGEAKNVIAAQGLGLDIAKQSETVRHNQATERNTRQSNRSAQRAKNREINKYGYTAKDWAALSTTERQHIIQNFDKTGGQSKSQSTQFADDFFRKYGVKPVSTEKIGSARDDIQSASSWIKRLLKSNPDADLGHVGETITNGQSGDKDNDAIRKHSRLMVRVAMDLKQYNGRISSGTADRLHRAGYSVRLLGLKTVGQKGAAGVQIRKRQPQKGPITSSGDPAGRFK